MAERGRGRPRDPKIDDAIAAAAKAVMLARGYHAASYAEIGRRAGVGTPAIYRRWPSKADMVIDLVERQGEDEPIPDTGSIRRDLASFMRRRIRGFTSPVFNQLVFPVSVEAKTNADLAKKVAHRMQAYRGPKLEPRIRKAIAAGELRPDTDPDRLIDVLMGTLAMPALFSRRLPRERDAQSIVDQVLEGFARKKKRGG